MNGVLYKYGYIHKPAGYLKIILGPMTSGKTTELIKEYNRHVAGGFKCCFINHSTDDRVALEIVKLALIINQL